MTRGSDSLLSDVVDGTSNTISWSERNRGSGDTSRFTVGDVYVGVPEISLGHCRPMLSRTRRTRRSSRKSGHP